MSATQARKHLSLWSYYRGALVILVAALALAVWLSGERLHSFLFEQLRQGLERQAQVIAAGIAEPIRTVGDSTCKVFAVDPEIRITIIETGGRVLCDSKVDRQGMENHGTRPELATALRGRVGSSTRFSDTVQENLLYVAVPVVKSRKIAYVVRTAVSLASIDKTISRLYETVFMAGLVFVIIVFALGFYLYRRINPPLQDIARGARHFAAGRFSTKLPEYEVREIDELARAMNSMAEQLERMEAIRRDFVANVSHELRTPVTSIRGFVETLLDGAKDRPRDLDRFLQIIARQSQRLSAIIEDLLILSRLESEPVGQLLQFDDCPLSELLASAKDLTQPNADEKNIRLNMECPQNLTVNVDRALMIQALINLVENAIKYSPSGTSVSIRGSISSAGRVRLDIADEGPGISAEHLDRVFERFYRVDKARSRELGGTGLGLAIVKHVATAHNGTVSVRSEVGKGSTFSMEFSSTRI